MSALEMKRIGPDEVEAVHDILRQCGEDMRDRFGLTHWIPPYPLDLMCQSVREKRVYAVLDRGQIIATFTVGSQPPFYYEQVSEIWEAPNAKALYLNRLAVLPPLQGQGIGRWCLSRVEQLAANEQCEAIRFDAYAKHQQLLTFYQHAGYHARGKLTVSTPRRGENEVICFEKVRRELTF